MFCLLPWSSNLGGFSRNGPSNSDNQKNNNKQSSSMLATPPSCASAGVSFTDSLSLPKHALLKRKRSPSPGAETPVASRFRPNEAAPENSQNDPVAPLSPSSQASPQSSNPHSLPNEEPSTPAVPRPKTIHPDKLRETLEAQLSLETLLKHNELRLIDQEMAKCQVALEQLRRCSEIPYPGSQLAGMSSSLSNGTGLVVYPPGNGPVPPSPAPWGVTDGPYSRHYARWLLPDPRFDGGFVDPAAANGGAMAAAVPGMVPGAGLPSLEGRSTRANPNDNGALAGTIRPQRGSGSGSKLQALPNGYPAPKERAGPMIIRRKSDGVMVKLVCLDCRRDNFSSTQGFINHCRIAHNRNFASHDAAAVASGEPVELDEAGAVVSESKPETPITPTTTTPGYVHPLVRSAHAIDPSQPSTAGSATAPPNAATSRKSSSGSDRNSVSSVETPRNTISIGPSPEKRRTPATADTNVSRSFLASPDTPHLSSLMQHHGVGVDLSKLVGEAKDTVDLGAYSSANEDDEEDSDNDEPVPPPSTLTAGMSEVRPGRQPVRTVGESSSQKLQNLSSHKSPEPLDSLTATPVQPGPSYISPYAPAANAEEQVDGMDIANLSPNTVESNQAPSLVSDDDDDDDGEAASDSGSPSAESSDAGDEADRAFSHIDVEDEDNDTATSATATTTTTTEPKGAPPGLANLSKPLRHGHARTHKKREPSHPSSSTLGGDKEEKRVSFVSPELSPDTSPSKGKDHARK